MSKTQSGSSSPSVVPGPAAPDSTGTWWEVQISRLTNSAALVDIEYDFDKKYRVLKKKVDSKEYGKWEIQLGSWSGKSSKKSVNVSLRNLEWAHEEPMKSIPMWMKLSGGSLF